MFFDFDKRLALMVYHTCFLHVMSTRLPDGQAFVFLAASCYNNEWTKY